MKLNFKWFGTQAAVDIDGMMTVTNAVKSDQTTVLDNETASEVTVDASGLSSPSRKTQVKMVIYDKDRKVIKEKDSLKGCHDLLYRIRLAPSSNLRTHEDEHQEIIYLDPRRFSEGRVEISIKGKCGSSYQVTEGAPGLPAYSDVIAGNGSYEVSIPFSLSPLPAVSQFDSVLWDPSGSWQPGQISETSGHYMRAILTKGADTWYVGIAVDSATPTAFPGGVAPGQPFVLKLGTALADVTYQQSDPNNTGVNFLYMTPGTTDPDPDFCPTQDASRVIPQFEMIDSNLTPWNVIIVKGPAIS